MLSFFQPNNALMESFYRTIKRELIQGANFETPEQAQREIFKYIELYYTTKKMLLSRPCFRDAPIIIISCASRRRGIRQDDILTGMAIIEIDINKGFYLLDTIN